MFNFGKRPLFVLSGLLVAATILVGAMVITTPTADAIPTDAVVVCYSWSAYACCPQYSLLEYQRRQCFLCSQGSPGCPLNWFEYRCVNELC